MSLKRCFLVGVCVFSLAGCGAQQTKSEVLVPAEGTVKLNGRPEEGIRLAFYPAGDTKAIGGCWGKTDDQGKYSVVHLSNKEGIPPGTYSVTFSRFVTPDGAPLGDNESPTMTKCRESIAALWSDLSKAGPHNKVVIPEKGSTTVNFNISSLNKK